MAKKAKAKFLDNKLFLVYLKEYKKFKDEKIELEQIIFIEEDEKVLDSLKIDLRKNISLTREVYEKIGEKLDRMAKRLLFSPKFINYTSDWKNEMYSEAMYNCVRYLDNFDTVTKTNPFAYYTTVIWNSFLQVLNKEKKIKMQKQVIIDKTWDKVCPNGDMSELRE